MFHFAEERNGRTAPIQRYDNHHAQHFVSISGDVESNPRPTKCTACDKNSEKKSKLRHEV